ncbi:hypothetical protein J4217_05000 [Candidatus Pacearchaeota archaeon]|nr:hypothetical protein [Candidatus Pacearchaeota archaeon]
MDELNIKVDLDELKAEKQRNFKERLWFITYWADYIKAHSDEEWSKQQAILIDSQIENARSLAKKKD